jgi:hypothetical protein
MCIPCLAAQANCQSAGITACPGSPLSYQACQQPSVTIASAVSLTCRWQRTTTDLFVNAHFRNQPLRHHRPVLCGACRAHPAEHVLAADPVSFPWPWQSGLLLCHLLAGPAPVAWCKDGNEGHLAVCRSQPGGARGAHGFRSRADRRTSHAAGRCAARCRKCHRSPGALPIGGQRAVLIRSCPAPGTGARAVCHRQASATQDTWKNCSPSILLPASKPSLPCCMHGPWLRLAHQARAPRSRWRSPAQATLHPVACTPIG